MLRVLLLYNLFQEKGTHHGRVSVSLSGASNFSPAPQCEWLQHQCVTVLWRWQWLWGQLALSSKVWLPLSFYLLCCMRMNGLLVTSINVSSRKRLHPSRTLERGSVPWQSIPADHSTFSCGTSFKALLKVLVWMSYTLNRGVLSKTLRYFPSSHVKEL